MKILARLLFFLNILNQDALGLPLSEYIQTASGLISTTYGYGEYMCGEVGSPRPCSVGAITSTNMEFYPDAPTAAIFVPASLYFRPTWIRLRVGDNACAWVLLNDKGNERFYKKRGFDLTPGALKVLGIKPSKYWKGVVHICDSE